MRRTLAPCLMLAALHTAPGAQLPSGEDIYLGRAPATAQLRGHAGTLPASAVACVNCHEPGPQVALTTQTTQTAASVGPRLDARMKQALPRRGGPATPFDEASFCHLLRSGFDPALVLVRKAMPQYRVSDAECAGLWQYLSTRPPLAPATR